ncbi:hypothetical protein V7S79_09830 [Aquirufa sp. ROCK-SH2]
MSIDHFLSRVWRVLSIIGFGITLLFIYRGLPDPTAVHFGESGRGDGFLPKEEIFYLTAGVITVLNVLMLMLINSVKKIPASLFASGVLRAFAIKGETAVQTIFIHWLHFFPAIVNTFVILALRVLLMLNDSRSYANDYTYLGYLGIVLILLWFLYLPIRLFSLPIHKEE